MSSTRVARPSETMYALMLVSKSYSYSGIRISFVEWMLSYTTTASCTFSSEYFFKYSHASLPKVLPVRGTFKNARLQAIDYGSNASKFLGNFLKSGIAPSTALITSVFP
mgnify:CR=1 FL=1|jgi:hypothetical protein